MSDTFSNVSTSVKKATDRSMSDTVMPTVCDRLRERTAGCGARCRAEAQPPGQRERADAAMRAAHRQCSLSEQVIADAQRVGHDRQRRVHGAARREEAAIDDVEVVHVVRLASRVERRRLRVAPEADRAVLVRDAGQRDALADEQAAREQALVALVTVHRADGLLLHAVLERRSISRLWPSSLFGV